METPGEREASLTAREREVMERVARGYTNKAIARELQISKHTVNGHMERILVKLGVPNRAAAVARWQRGREDRGG